MRASFVSLAVLFCVTLADVLGASSKEIAALVAAYDAILATVGPEQTTVALGDMIVSVETVRLWRDQFAGTAPPGSASKTGINKWTGGNVYYAFNANVSAAHQAAFVDAARDWESFANLHFIPRTSQTNYIMVNDGGSGLSGGNSSLGMIGGQQQLNIGAVAWNRGTLLHEIGHALGLIHEHQRSDRDTYVTINFSNVPGGTSNGDFILTPTSTNNGAYDFLSIMQYSRNASAVNSAIDTVTPKAGYTQFIDIMGNNPDRELSRADRNGISLMYGAGPVLTTVVTNTQDSGPGSLRAAIYKAFDIVTDTPAATPTITFQIPNTDPGFSGGVFTIKPSDRMTAPGSKTTIDATTQTIFGGDTNPSGPEIALNGALQNDPSTYGLGFRLSGANVTVKGFVINGFGTRGILITGTGATGCTIAGCYIGTNAAGAAASANSFAGIEINNGASGNTIGGATAAARNVISGNLAQGIYINGSGTNGNIITGNFVGTNAAGTAAIANGYAGVLITAGASANTVGSGNVLSGNTNQGVAITGANGNIVSGNFIGTNAAGTGAIPNAYAGVQIFGGAQFNTIGGSTSAARNILSGNASQGATISGAGTSNNTIAGNYAGLNAAGTAALPNAYAGIQIFGDATNNTVGGTAPGSGNVLSGNNGQGVSLSDAGTTGNVVAGNFIGTNPAGTAAIANAYSGIGIFSGATGNTIGGTVSGAGNLVSGNSNQGVLILSAGTNNNVVAGNLIGTNAAGTTALANAYAGVEISGGPQNNVIGGTMASARNVISGNANQGVSLNGTGTSGNRVSGNYIGTNAAGAAAIANGFPGIEIFSSATANIIGGTAPGAGNVISGNGSRGMTITGANSNTVAGNFIGLNAAGTAALPNAGPGIQIFGGAQGNTIGATTGGRNFISGNNGAGLTISGSPTNGNIVIGNSIGTSPAGAAIANTSEGIALFADGSGGTTGNIIGGSTLGAANFISRNATAGVAIYNTGTTGNRISGNSITANGGLGIDIWGDGHTNNDAGDPDTGPNNLQNHPTLTSAVLGTSTTVAGTLNSTASTTFRIEFFDSAAADASGFGEGLNFIGAVNTTTNGSGNATLNAVLPVIVPAGHLICATATDPAGNTSEFSANVTVTTTDTDGDGLPNAYETANGLSTSVADANVDTDGDGMTNAQEFRARTDPRSQSSVLRLGAPVVAGSDVTISLPTVLGLTYRVDVSDDLAASPQWRILTDQIPGTGSALIITDPAGTTLPRRFYRAVVLP